MADIDEVVLFEQQNVKVTTLRVIIRDGESYPISEFRSAELGHREPRAVEWIGIVGAGAVLIAGFGAWAILTEMPTGEMDSGRPGQPIPPETGWKGVAYLIVFGVIALAVYLVARYISRKSIVRVETTSDESKILFESRNPEDVKRIVRAIQLALRRVSAR